MVKIAIIEDDHAISQMYQIKFEHEGFKVKTAENGKVGLELCLKYRPDIILLDLMMPEMTGDQVLDELYKTDWAKKTKVVILTNLGKEDNFSNLRDKYKIKDYIVKAETTPTQVVKMIRELAAS